MSNYEVYNSTYPKAGGCFCSCEYGSATEVGRWLGVSKGITRWLVSATTSPVPWQCLWEQKRLLVLKELLAEVTKLLLCVVPFIKATLSLSCASSKGIRCCSFSLIGLPLKTLWRPHTSLLVDSADPVLFLVRLTFTFPVWPVCECIHASCWLKREAGMWMKNKNFRNMLIHRSSVFSPTPWSPWCLGQ